MKILVDIGHPAHVHFFRNFIRIMNEKGHSVIVIARNKDVSFQLLDAFNIDYIDFGRHYKHIITKILGGLYLVCKLYLFARREKIDVFVDSGGTVFPAIAAFFLRKPSISFNNTDVFFMLKLSRFFTTVFITPDSYRLDLGSKHIRCKSFNELAFLHPNYFKSDPRILERLGINKSEPLILLRFVQWKAAEELGCSGFSFDDIREIVELSRKCGQVLVSCEYDLPSELSDIHIEKQQKIKYGEMQDIECNSTIFLGESGAMSAECAMLGTPSIFLSTKQLGFIDELDKKYNLVYAFSSKEKAFEQFKTLLQKENLKEEWQQKKEKMLSEKIDITSFMIWFIEHYPVSFQIMKSDPSYQNRFISKDAIT